MVSMSVSRGTSRSTQTGPRIVHCYVPGAHLGAGQRVDRQTGIVAREAVTLAVLRQLPGFPGQVRVGSDKKQVGQLGHKGREAAGRQ